MSATAASPCLTSLPTHCQWPRHLGVELLRGGLLWPPLLSTLLSHLTLRAAAARPLPHLTPRWPKSTGPTGFTASGSSVTSSSLSEGALGLDMRRKQAMPWASKQDLPLGLRHRAPSACPSPSERALSSLRPCRDPSTMAPPLLPAAAGRRRTASITRRPHAGRPDGGASHRPPSKSREPVAGAVAVPKACGAPGRLLSCRWGRNPRPQRPGRPTNARPSGQLRCPGPRGPRDRRRRGQGSRASHPGTTAATA